MKLVIPAMSTSYIFRPPSQKNNTNNDKTNPKQKSTSPTHTHKKKKTPQKPMLQSWSCFRLDLGTLNYFIHGTKQCKCTWPRGAHKPIPSAKPSQPSTPKPWADPSLPLLHLLHRILTTFPRHQGFHQLFLKPRGTLLNCFK